MWRTYHVRLRFVFCACSRKLIFTRFARQAHTRERTQKQLTILIVTSHVFGSPVFLSC
jgi:hypothetical protein